MDKMLSNNEIDIFKKYMNQKKIKKKNTYKIKTQRKR